MQLPYRATRWLRPSAGETIVKSRAEAEALIQHIEKILLVKGPKKLDKSQRAHNLSARAGLYAAIGSPKMLEAARDALDFCKCSNTYALVAMSLHHFGRIKEANKYYELSYKQPHEAGWEVDLSYAQSLMSQGRFLDAWKVLPTLKKRMVYAGYLPTWDGKPCDEVQVISEGGFGDLLHMARYLPMIQAKKVTVFLPDFFFEHGFVSLARRQTWFPEIKYLVEAEPDIPSIGFFDFPWRFATTPETIPDAPIWDCDHDFANLHCGSEGKPVYGLCWAARSMETPLVRPGVYRAMTEEQANKIVQSTKHKICWISLQKGETLPDMEAFDLKSWDDTAALISNLDAVVSVDTAVFHLTASLGKPVHLILSGCVDWKFQFGDKCDWYKNVKVYPNRDFGFDSSVSNLIEELNGKF